MTRERRRIGIWLVLAAIGWVTQDGGAGAPKFYPDDPITKDPETEDASHVRPWDISDPYDFVENTFLGPGDNSDRRAPNANTIDEVPDSSWFTNRIGSRPMSVEEIVKGPDQGTGPAQGKWTIVAGKSEGITPGVTIRDSTGQIYFIKFDPPSNPEMATGAEIVSTKFFHALGYHVAENYVATLRRENLVIGERAALRRPDGTRAEIREKDVDDLLQKAARGADGAYRVIASKLLEGKDLGPFRYYGTRPDDPNDIFPHEHRRELRGLRVFAAWLNHDDTRSINSRDFLVEREGRRIVRHNLLDFGSTLGSGSVAAQRRRAGNEYLWEARPTFITMLTLGLYVRPWIKVDYPDLPAVGRIEAAFFQPALWKPEYPNPAFDNARPDDTFWAARRVVAFSDEAIRAVVKTARYSDPRAEEYLADVIIKRRDKVGRLWLNSVCPLVDFALDPSGVLTFTNAAVDANLATEPSRYELSWARVDNGAGIATPVGQPTTHTETRARAPSELLTGAYEFTMLEALAAHADHPQWRNPVRVYFRRLGSGWKVVGIERTAGQEPKPSE